MTNNVSTLILYRSSFARSLLSPGRRWFNVLTAIKTRVTILIHRLIRELIRQSLFFSAFLLLIPALGDRGFKYVSILGPPWAFTLASYEISHGNVEQNAPVTLRLLKPQQRLSDLALRSCVFRRRTFDTVIEPDLS